MFESIYRGKNFSEDILTANFFGLLRLLPDRYFFDLMFQGNWHSNSSEIKLFEYWFPLSHGIPDLLVNVDDNDQKHVIAVEIKHGAGPSGDDQLMRY